jgi:hypothetical protein
MPGTGLERAGQRFLAGHLQQYLPSGLERDVEMPQNSEVLRHFLEVRSDSRMAIR